ncbi:hypothetical protein DEU34_1393 [Microbacterium sp. AG1240]|uniref:hypothetical protein n=1 Tax=Microbacterium sp. AG1240 TaxID=2183992 RepID=UPI000F217C82|nr:hypothetical protein [Microbacterium sp. AG1240]RKT36865.1 hypothetical protein DEU34_1393 [Microbacterium sp. AG1240]
MTDQKKLSFWRRLIRVFTGRPMSREEMQRQRELGEQDPMTRIQFDMRSTRNSGGWG